MFWLMGFYYTVVLCLMLFVFLISYTEPALIAVEVMFMILICSLPAIIFVEQKKKYKKDIENTKSVYDEQIAEIEAQIKQKTEVIDSEFERLKSINVVETNDLAANVEEHLSNLVPTMDGKTYEIYVGYKLALNGWSDITFTPVTGDYGADIIATDKEGSKVCIQCKRYDSSVGIDAVQEVIAAKQYYGAYRAVVATNSVMTQQARNMAQKTGVELWEKFI